MTKIESTLMAIEKTIAKYRNPALMVSFGKDSTALWAMARHWNLPIICHQTPWQPNRWAWAQKMIQDFQLQVYDWPPEWVALQDHGEQGIELVSAYTIGGKKPIGIRQKIEDDIPHERRVCGLYDCIRRPRGTIQHDWDLLICAQKDGDPDNLGGRLSVPFDIQQNPTGADCYFPLRNWSDEEVWSFIHAEGVPYNERLYRNNDRLVNPDFVSGCFDCVRKDRPESVKYMRLHGQMVNNISATAPYLTAETKI